MAEVTTNSMSILVDDDNILITWHSDSPDYVEIKYADSSYGIDIREISDVIDGLQKMREATEAQKKKSSG